MGENFCACGDDEPAFLVYDELHSDARQMSAPKVSLEKNPQVHMAPIQKQHHVESVRRQLQPEASANRRKLYIHDAKIRQGTASEPGGGFSAHAPTGADFTTVRNEFSKGQLTNEPKRTTGETTVRVKQVVQTGAGRPVLNAAGGNIFCVMVENDSIRPRSFLDGGGLGDKENGGAVLACGQIYF